MRKFVLVFEGMSYADEMEISDNIQGAVFEILQNNGMSVHVRHYSNEQIPDDRMPDAGKSNRLPRELQIPEFMAASEVSK